MSRAHSAPRGDAGGAADLDSPVGAAGARAAAGRPARQTVGRDDEAEDGSHSDGEPEDGSHSDDTTPELHASEPARRERPAHGAAPARHGKRVVPADRAEYSRPERSARATTADDDARKLVWFTINIGRSKNADPKWLIPLLCRRGGISKNAIGKIQILARETRVEISHDVSERFAAAVREPDTKDRNIHIEPLDSLAV